MFATYFLAIVLGWYLVIMGIFLISRRGVILSAMNNIMAQPGLLLIVGFITLLIGLLMVASHNVWVMGWPVIITIIGWVAVISGIIRLFCPETVHHMWNRMLTKPETFTASGIVMLLLGFYLLFNVYFM